MSMFTLAISCLTTSWFTGLTFQVPMQYCSLQHQALLSPPDTSTTEHYFHFGPATSFFLELFLCSSPVAYWTSSNLGGSSSGVLSFCFFILFMGFSRQEYWRDSPFPPSVDHVLLEFFTATCLGCPCTTWLITSLSYANPFAMTRQWSMTSLLYA